MTTQTVPYSETDDLYIEEKIPVPSREDMRCEGTSYDLLWQVLRYVAESDCACGSRGTCVVCFATVLGFGIFGKGFHAGDALLLGTCDSWRAEAKERYSALTGRDV